MPDRCVSKQTLQRLPAYLNYLRSPGGKTGKNVSATSIAEALGLNDVVVRKDLASVSSKGRPKVGYARAELIRELESSFCVSFSCCPDEIFNRTITISSVKHTLYRRNSIPFFTL